MAHATDLAAPGWDGTVPEGGAGSEAGGVGVEWREAQEVPTIVIRLEWCKACGICVDVCPADVYRAGADGRPMVVAAQLCIWCERCEIYCPDLAIELHGQRAW